MIDFKIPDASVEIIAAQFAISEHGMPLHSLPEVVQLRLRNHARVAAGAALKAWPGMIVGNSLFDGEPMAFLPIQETANG